MGASFAVMVPKPNQRHFSPSALREARTRAELTQEELAEECRTQKQQVSRYECGESVPTLDVLLRLAVALHVDVKELLESA